MTNYLTWVNHWDHFSFLAFVQITTVYGFSPWRGQIFEIFESKGPWYDLMGDYDLMDDLMNPTLPISSPNRLVFLRFLELLNCFVGFRDRKGFYGLWLVDKIWQNIKMKTTLSKSNVKNPALPKRRLGWGLGIQSGLDSIAYKRNEKSENRDDQSNSTAVTNLSKNQTASYERHFTHNLYNLYCGI